MIEARESIALFTLAKRIGPVSKKNKSDSTMTDTETKEQRTMPSDEKLDEIDKEFYTEIGGEG